jgi:O-antigen/teichoic acid export membrane protein
MTLQEIDTEAEKFSRAAELPQSASGRGMFFSNVAWMLVGNLVYGFSQWAQVVVLAKVGTMETVGNFALALAICLPVLMFSSLSLRVLQVTDTTRSHRLLEYASLRVLTVLGSLVFIVIAELALGKRGTVVLSTFLISAAKSVEYISDILYGSLQQREDMSGIGISMTLRAIFALIALTLAVYFTHSLVWGAASMLVGSMLVLFVYDIPKAVKVGQIDMRKFRNEFGEYCREVLPQGGHRRLWKLAVTGLPMGFIMMLVSLNLNIPRYFIEQHLGTRELAIFSAMATLLTAGSVVTNAMGQAAALRVANSFSNRDWREFSFMLGTLVLTSLGLGAVGFAGAFLFGTQAMRILYRPEYATRQDVLLWLMGSSGLLYLGSTLGYAVTAVRCLKPQVPLFISAVVTTAIGCIALVPSRGLRGVAMAILLSAIVQCVGSAGLLWNACRKVTAESCAAA